MKLSIKGLTSKSLLLGLLVAGFSVTGFAATASKQEIASAKMSNEPSYTASSDSVLMRYQFKPGTTYRMNMGMKMTNHVSAQGRSLTMNMGMTMAADFKNQKVFPDGHADVEIKFTKLTMNMNMMGRTVSFDSSQPNSNPAFKPMAAMLNVPINMKISNLGIGMKGDFSKLYGSISRAGATGPQQAKNMKKTMDEFMKQALVRLPKQQVKVGDVYDAGSIKTSDKMGTVMYNLKYYVAAISADKKFVVLRPIMKVSLVSAQARLVSSAVKGWILFNNQEGKAVEARSEVVMKMLMNNMNVTSTANVHLTAK